MDQTGMIFDMDGVLFDTEKLFQETWHEIAAERGITLGEDWVKTISGTSGDLMNKIIGEFFHVEDGDPIRLDCFSRMQHKLKRNVPIKAGVPEILSELKKENKKIAIASSSGIDQIESNLRVSGLTEYFDAIVSGYEVEHGKPEPDIFLLAAQKLGCAPKDCVVFEDSKNGVLAGVNAGMFVCMIPDLMPPTDDLRAKCGAVKKDFFEVLKGL